MAILTQNAFPRRYFAALAEMMRFELTNLPLADPPYAPSGARRGIGRVQERVFFRQFSP